MTRQVIDPVEERGDTESGSSVYRRILWLYPRAFREEFGEEMMQVFSALRRDGRRGLWRLMARDLVVSLGREHGSSLAGSRLVSLPVLFVITAGVTAAALTGNVAWVVLPLATLFVLPTVAASLLSRAWRHRGTGRRAAPSVALAGALLVPAVFTIAEAGDDLAWLIAMGVGLATISGAIVGVIWASEVFLTARRSAEANPRKRKAAWVAGLALVAVAAIAGAGYNSYRNSQPPPGDHSVANASDESRALWEAAYAGDGPGVERLVAACADPFVQFSGHGLTDFRSRSAADHQRGGWGNDDPVPNALQPRYDRIVDVLQDAEDTWAERCNADGAR